MSRLLASAAAVALLSTAAFAADLPLPMEPMEEMAAPSAVYDWTGIYVGINGGYGWGDTVAYNNVGVTSGGYDMEGFVFGGQVGANWQMNWLVLGAEADIQWSDISGSLTAGPCAAVCTTAIDWFGTVRGRVGLALDRFLVYGTGGLAFGDVSGSVSSGAFSGTDTNVGWAAGGGAEFGITEHLSFKGEYLFMDLDRVSYPGVGVTIFHDADENHLVRGGVNWRF